MKKLILSTLIAVGLIGSAGALRAQMTYGDFNYQTDGSVVSITGYRGTGGDVSIPNSINGMPVTSIAVSAFYGITSITNIIIPPSVTSIGTNAFTGCTSLPLNPISSGGSLRYIFWGNGIRITYCNSLVGNFTLPSKIANLPVTSIGDYAFAQRSYVSKMAIPTTVTSIGDYAFLNCNSLSLLAIPNSVNSIGEGAFKGCSALTNIVISSGVTSIARSTFAGCSALNNIYIPPSITFIGDYAFSQCRSLSSLTIPNSVTSFGWDPFSNCNSLPLTNGLRYVIFGSGISIIKYIGGGDNLTIPSSIDGLPVTSIFANAFESSLSLTNIVIPSTVTSIGDYAFYGCRNLRSITIPNSLLSIGCSAFEECSALKSVNIPDKLLSISDSLFYGCCSLTSITIPNSVTSIGVYSFNGCSALKNINIPNNVISIGESALSGCNNRLKVLALSYNIWNFLTQNAGLIGIDPSQILRGTSAYLKNQTINFSKLTPKSWTNAPFALAAKASSILPITYTSSDFTVSTVSNNILIPVGVGTATITAYQEGNTIYNPAKPVSQEQIITLAPQKITFPAIPSHTYGDGPFILSATNTSNLPITYTSSDSNVATVSENIVTIVGAGTAKITAFQSGNALYAAATTVSQSLKVAKANQTVTFNPTTPLTCTVGGIVPLSASASSMLPITYTSSKSSVITIVNGANQGLVEGKGTTTITATQSGNSNYNKALATATITLQ